jgi:hypothetical protein
MSRVGHSSEETAAVFADPGRFPRRSVAKVVGFGPYRLKGRPNSRRDGRHRSSAVGRDFQPSLTPLPSPLTIIPHRPRFPESCVV